MILNISEEEISRIENWFWCTDSESKADRFDKILFAKIISQKVNQ